MTTRELSVKVKDISQDLSDISDRMYEESIMDYDAVASIGAQIQRLEMIIDIIKRPTNQQQ